MTDIAPIGERLTYWATLGSITDKCVLDIREARDTIERYETALAHISKLTASGPHISAKDRLRVYALARSRNANPTFERWDSNGMGAALSALDRARDIARAALTTQATSDDGGSHE